MPGPSGRYGTTGVESTIVARSATQAASIRAPAGPLPSSFWERTHTRQDLPPWRTLNTTYETANPAYIFTKPRVGHRIPRKGEPIGDWCGTLQQ